MNLRAGNWQNEANGDRLEIGETNPTLEGQAFQCIAREPARCYAGSYPMRCSASALRASGCTAGPGPFKPGGRTIRVGSASREAACCAAPGKRRIGAGRHFGTKKRNAELASAGECHQRRTASRIWRNEPNAGTHYPMAAVYGASAYSPDQLRSSRRSKVCVGTARSRWCKFHARARPIRHAGMAGAIGQAGDLLVSAETEVLGARFAYRPATMSPLQLEQRADMGAADRHFVDRKPRLLPQRLDNLVRVDDPGARNLLARHAVVVRSHRLPCCRTREARQAHPMRLADDRVAAHPELARDLCA